MSRSSSRPKPLHRLVTKSETLARVPPLYRLARYWRDQQHVRRHPPTRAKHQLIRETALTHGLKILVETGTYTGETSWAMRHEFERIETIELEPTLAALARVRFRRTPSVRLHEGDSAVVLEQIVASLEQPALFWLDAHPCTDRAASGTAIPLVRELATIAAHRVKGHVMLIDDLRLMSGADGYPSLDDLMVPEYRLVQVGDVGVLSPDLLNEA